jgi:L-ascorbate metabolism protein UlaG (beta-lactamase superfamily)
LKLELQTQPLDLSFFEPRENTIITWLGMAGAIVNSRGVIILIDPLITTVTKNGRAHNEVGYPLKLPHPIQADAIPRADLILYTHADEDHFGRTTAKMLVGLNGKFYVPPPVADGLRDIGVPLEQVEIAREGESVRAGEVEVIVTPALHDWQEENPWKREDCCGFLLKTPDGVIWHPGDTRMIPELLEVKDVDVLFFDIAAVDSHLGPQGSAQLALSSGAKQLIAYHYGTFDLPPGTFATCDPRDALPYLDGVPARFLQLHPGEVLELPARF